MVGSSLSIAAPLFILNTIVADVLAEFADRLEKATDLNAEVSAIVRETVLKHERIIFNGNNYATEWVEEAERRGLLNLKTTPDALPYFIKPENIALFERHGVLTKAETLSRTELLLESYAKIINIEAVSMLEIAKRGVVPAVIEYSSEVAQSIERKLRISKSIGTNLEGELLIKLSTLGDKLGKDIASLEKTLSDAENQTGTLATAQFYGSNVISAMNELRETVDTLETLVDENYWPLPSYGEILYSVK